MEKEALIRLRRSVMERAFSRMNDQQRAAVFATEGPLLILAGAGSGKTTVLVNRVACLIQYGRAYHSTEVPFWTPEQQELLHACADGRRPIDREAAALCAVDPCEAYRILAITFTNKAAGELKDRLASMLGEEGNDVAASTFHSFCARLLRFDADRLGFSRHFTIYDTDDSRRLMKDCMKALGIEEKVLGHKTILAEIGRAKDQLLTPAAYADKAGSDYRLKKVAACYEAYQRRLKEADAMDFDDLLFHTVTLLSENADILERYQRRFRYILIDEYQDTNHAQYRLISLLAAKSRNLCVVGDDDQSIYKFRGATIENILSFEEEFPGCRVIRLEQNYRSTKNILGAANAVIAKNIGRKGKTLWTDNEAGDKIQLVTLENEDEEARFVADTILDRVAGGQRFRDFAVLYRMNAQSNALERALIKSGVPYRIIGGHRFNDAMEVRDAIAYLRVIHNPSDAVSLKRIINQPKRGIGDATVEKASAIADGLGVPLYEVLLNAEDYPDIRRAAAKIRSFTDGIEALRAYYANSDDPDYSLHALYEKMLDTTGYLDMWKQAGEPEAQRVENLSELSSSILHYEQTCGDDIPELGGYLEENALMTDVDNYDSSSDAVVLMTMHAAKGLEFPVVFVPGFEDGIFPGLQSLFQPEELEEDRRLCYVAITRAKQTLYLLNAASRMLFGTTGRNRPSRFRGDIPPELTQESDRRLTSRSWGGSAGQTGFSPRGEARSFAPAYTPRFPSTGQPADPSPAGRPSFSGGGIAAGKSAGPAAVSGTFAPGDVVSHKTFGTGVVQQVAPMGNDTLLTIRFENMGVKKLMANFAHLKKG